MQRRNILLAISTLVAIGVGAAVLRPSAPVMAARDAAADLTLRNHDVTFYEQRVKEDPSSAADLAQLAGLYMQRAREAGDYEDFRRAERAARSSWSLRENRNGRALHMLASALLAQHKFADARAAAEQLVNLDPSIISWAALLAEIQLELGDYNAAARSFAALETRREDLAVAPRLARWYELIGRNDDAAILLRRARESALSRSDLPHEQKAWFFLRTADHALRNGKLRQAVSAARHGLQVNPGDVRLIGLIAKVAFERADYEDVTKLIEPIVAQADIATLSMLGDAYANLNGHALAQNVFALIEQRAAENPEPFNRQWTQFRLDHGVELEKTVALLESEAAVRPDVLGYAMLAQGYLKLGRTADARAAMQKALRLGTQDRQLDQHAKAIL